MIKFLFLFLLSVSGFQLYAQHEVPPTSGFDIVGNVRRELKFQFGNIAGFRQDTLGDLIIRNKKGDQKSIAKGAKGILLKTIIDSAGILVDKPKEYSELDIVLTASDGYKNVYSWNELFNSEVGNHVYVVTEMDNKTMSQMPDRVLVVSLSDFNSGSRHLKGLAKIEVKKVQ